MSFTLPTKEEKADYVHRQFERIAAGYDLTNDVISLGMHRLWKEAAVDALNPQPDGSYLDVCCGTGDLALTIARRLGSGGHVTGVDFSANMLEVAEARSQRAQRDAGSSSKQEPDLAAEMEWVIGDAQNLPFAARQFDGAIISFGLRNLTDLPRGIKEMCRVVKSGGKVVNLDLGHPTHPLFAPFFLTFFRHVVPLIGQILQDDRQAYTYLPRSLDTYPKPEGISQIMRESGLVDVRYCPQAWESVALHVGTVP